MGSGTRHLLLSNETVDDDCRLYLSCLTALFEGFGMM